MYNQNETTILLFINVMSFLINVFLLQVNSYFKKTTYLPKVIKNKINLILLWIMSLLPITIIFILKLNFIFTNLYTNLLVVIILIGLNTTSLLLYYKYYLHLINQCKTKKTININKYKLYKILLYMNISIYTILILWYSTFIII